MSARLSKRTLGTVGAVAGVSLIVLLYVLIFGGILTEQRRQATIEEQIAPIETALASQQEGPPVLSIRQAELATVQAELAAAQFAFPSEMDSTEVLDYVISAASDYGVHLRRVQVRDPLTATVGVDTYRALAYDVDVEGELRPLSAFLTALETGPISTLTLDQIRLQAQSTTTYDALLVVQVYVRQE